MKKLVLIVLTVLAYSCAGTNLYNKVNYGRYNAKYDFYTGNISIKPDGTFEYTRTIPHRNNICKGNWEVISRNKILLNGLDIKNYESVDSIFFDKLNCENDTITFLSNTKFEFKHYIFRNIRME